MQIKTTMSRKNFKVLIQSIRKDVMETSYNVGGNELVEGLWNSRILKSHSKVYFVKKLRHMCTRRYVKYTYIYIYIFHVLHCCNSKRVEAIQMSLSRRKDEYIVLHSLWKAATVKRTTATHINRGASPKHKAEWKKRV